MKNYDDLQRFKEKTQTNHIQFKDMSDQLLKRNRGADWVIIRQLTQPGEGRMLENAASVTHAPPQAVDPTLFARQGPSSPAQDPAPQSASIPAPTSAMSGISVGGLLNALSAIAPASAAPSPAAHNPVQATPSALSSSGPLAGPGAVVHPAAAVQAAPSALFNAGTLPTAGAFKAAPAADSPDSRVATGMADFLRSTPPPAAPTANRPHQGTFRQLFSAQSGSAPDSKDVLLQPLLEKIASCR
ncbi:hypothetical protein BL250_09410 [Erwinia sp. OLTSP20]|uniref:cellulose biosynthesis protein BcsO n=1 Tax=unclassified Erwinia TaxID=2622719 RepID=UPI000C1A236C|nr:MULTISPECIES: cellulose biosynthesis protein BcsO [unclassified Erwinia]PIJ50742.1 hypothetical protein BV501_07090 [Erwinia sp. OAMSP11]PIJ75411.1 hypothetical protein BK416_01885 [Erwinia sp. OLSSP12]PIJ81909.1 hypothetical protein BLD47_07435 [Erwinia sp. OLCASP19]PIJ84564.1 hypothetical protein BLD46_07525 [Erwinia sp. OLMTSP26]PIJ86911.1 hypothetical protein BLD49_07295 [Erwinia sp. OLMDSP33]